MSSSNTRISLSAFFQNAHMRGLSLQFAAEQLLAQFKDDESGFIAWGLLKVYTLDENIEVLPRRLFPEAIPFTFWHKLEEVGDNCVSSWCDNPEKPMCFTEIDWVAGTGQIVDWEFDPELTFYWHKWSGIEVPKALADKLLKQISRSPDFSAKVICDTDSDAIRQTFIREYPGNSPDDASMDWNAHPAYDGTKRREFREEWKLLRGQKERGRPPKNAAR